MKILIVDDSKAMRMLVSLNLRKAGYSGHTIIEADNGAAGLEMVLAHEPDLVMSDWNMPQMTGIELLQAINTKHESDQLEKKPVFVFVTSESTHDMVSAATDLGARCFITKPFSADIFEKKLTNIIR
ncbi:response regulator [Legionella sp. CNM-4043-24]|uniref:response regulator n=1 Tax=Legionella sp. CNM-4043-24 TaxID=3421646 RepID=UPI00403ABEFF